MYGWRMRGRRSAFGVKASEESIRDAAHAASLILCERHICQRRQARDPNSRQETASRQHYPRASR